MNSALKSASNSDIVPASVIPTLFAPFSSFPFLKAKQLMQSWNVGFCVVRFLAAEVSVQLGYLEAFSSFITRLSFQNWSDIMFTTILRYGIT